jgi:alkaline phosphatase D
MRLFNFSCAPHAPKGYFTPFAAAFLFLTLQAPLQAQQATELVPRGAEAAEFADAEAYSPRPVDTVAPLAVIAFGSCNKLDKPQNMWDAIVANNPNLWIWLGDIVYADTEDMKALAADYKRLKMEPGYKALRKSTQIIGIYDDHDYGKNDGDKTFPMKKGAQKALLDFLDVPRNAPVRRQEGAYCAYTFGQGPGRVKVIMLDTRYFRDPLQPDSTKQRRYLPNTEGDMLGEAQWQWLENELRNSEADLNILCSSVQVLADEHPYEKWGNFPAARKRLLNLIVRTQPKNLLILSGDRHMAEISRLDVQGLPYPLYDFTSSGLTHIRSGLSETNKLRAGELILQRNFGLLKIFWENGRPVVRMEVRGLQNELFQETIARYE